MTGRVAHGRCLEWRGSSASPTRSWRSALGERFGRSFELAVFAAAPIETDVHWTAITLGLARNAGPDTLDRPTSCLRYLFTALDTIRLALAVGDQCPYPEHAVCDGVVDLILYRPIRGPAGRHFDVLLGLPRQDMGPRSARSKNGSIRHVQMCSGSEASAAFSVCGRDQALLSGRDHGTRIVARMHVPRDTAAGEQVHHLLYYISGPEPAQRQFEPGRTSSGDP